MFIIFIIILTFLIIKIRRFLKEKRRKFEKELVKGGEELMQYMNPQQITKIRQSIIDCRETIKEEKTILLGYLTGLSIMIALAIIFLLTTIKF
ncbi:MAG: hypothetical protein WC349_03035 [Patescibacteria group bacterium]|jgi:hypothetical protein